MTEEEASAVAAEAAANSESHVSTADGATPESVADTHSAATEVASAEAAAADSAATPAATPAATSSKRRKKSAEPDQLQLFEINLADPELPSSGSPFESRVEATILLADRPISDARIAEVLGLVPPSVRAVKEGKDSKDAKSGDRDGDRDGGDVSAEDSAALAGRRREAIRLVREACDTLNQQYAATNRAFRIESVSGGRQMLTIAAFGQIVTRLKGQRAQTRLSQAALETLAIIAYRQPMLRAQLEAIRGVACGEVLKSLMERRLVKIVGRAEEVGRPMLYGTTPEFLRVFGIANLSDLPQAKDLR
jgi:segregation and condensation protein B